MLVIVFVLLNIKSISAAVSCDVDSGIFCYVRNQAVSATEQFQVTRSNDNPFTILILSSTVMPVLSSTIFMDYPNITFLSMSDNGFKAIYMKNFANAVKLEKLFISNGLLKRINNGTFRNCPNLVNLQITNHNISIVEVYAFQGLTKLNSLSLQNNSIEVLRPLVFSMLPNLNSLILDLNRIKMLGAKLFAQNTQLFYLTIESNQLTSVNSNAFNENQQINSIYLNNNFLTSVRTFGAQYVDLSFNSLTSVRIDPGTQTLHLHDNFISTLSCDNTNLSSIQRLFAANNSLPNFNCIRDMDGLKELDVTRNKFPRPAQAVFAKLTNLTQLTMFNQTKFLKIAVKVFSPLKNLGVLRVDRLIAYKNVRQVLPKIYMVSLITRTWNCSYTQQVANVLSSQGILMNYNYYPDRSICNVTPVQPTVSPATVMPSASLLLRGL